MWLQGEGAGRQGRPRGLSFTLPWPTVCPLSTACTAWLLSTAWLQLPDDDKDREVGGGEGGEEKESEQGKRGEERGDKARQGKAGGRAPIHLSQLAPIVYQRHNQHVSCVRPGLHMHTPGRVANAVVHLAASWPSGYAYCAPYNYLPELLLAALGLG